MSAEPVEMIDCDEALDLLHEFLKQRLTEDTAAQVEAHLEACGPCLTNARFEGNYLRMVEDKLKSIRCPDESRERILTALRGMPYRA